MRGSRASRAILPAALVLAVALTSGCGPESPSSSSTLQFVSVVRQSQADYNPFDTPQALARESELIVVGTIEAVSEGVGYFINGDSDPTIPTVRWRIKVEGVVRGQIKGNAGGVLDVLVLRPPTVPLDSYVKSAVPAQRGIFFLSPMTDIFGADGFRRFPRGLDESSVLFSPSVQGVILEDTTSKELIGGLISNDEYPDGWDLSTTLDKFAASL